MIVFIAFTLLGALTLLVKSTRDLALRTRQKSDWLVDATGLVMQGWVVPAIQVGLAYGIFAYFWPSARASLEIPAPLAFGANFIFVDYLYYWNHRLLHHAWLWRAHRVHHAGESLDLFVTSRNTLWTPLLIVYLWVNAAFIFWLKDPAPFLIAASLSACLDLWRHTSFGPRPGSRAHHGLARWLITPAEHHWHHSDDAPGVNFGANLAVWDRLHGTYREAHAWPRRYGSPLARPLLRRLFLP